MTEMTKETLQAKLAESEQQQKVNWEQHFKEHPEQLQPGAEVERVVPDEESGLLAEIIGRCPLGPDTD